MADERLRFLLKRYRETQAPADEAAWIQARLQAGEEVPGLANLAFHDAHLEWIDFDPGAGRLEIALELPEEQALSEFDLASGSLVLLGVESLVCDGPERSILERASWGPEGGAVLELKERKPGWWSLCFETEPGPSRELNFHIVDFQCDVSYFSKRGS